MYMIGEVLNINKLSAINTKISARCNKSLNLVRHANINSRLKVYIHNGYETSSTRPCSSIVLWIATYGSAWLSQRVQCNMQY